MTDGPTTKAAYFRVCSETGRDPDGEILAVVNHAIDEQILEQTEFCTLKLHANKRNVQNEKYRRKLNDQDVDTLCRTLQCNTFVVGLDLGYNSVTDAGAKILSTLLQETLILKELVLSYNDITSEGALDLAKGLQMNETLLVLKLNGNKICNKGALAIAGSLQVNTILQELDMADTDMGTESCVAISTVLKYNNSLKVLNINRPIVHPSQEESIIVHIAGMLKVNRSLEEIHLAKCGIRDFGAERLAENLVYNTGLKHLDLRCNRVTRDGARCLGKLLKKDTPLEILNLACNRIEDDGACALSEALAYSNTKLQTLVVCSNKIATRGLCSLAKTMKTNSSLRRIYIWGNKLLEPVCNVFQELMSGRVPRLAEEDTDVTPYVVDGITYLSQTNSPY
ncbi:leucine-rich repeat-containing protein 34-like [Dendronephthya gigantea]|uniref:leucine-rich repeat-containing protein 34-like n=1 Tax=Dendronephthya gigantea TaxID=151771 RepID=UPI00106CAE37|nr:leucine-rich repeat-containing protein 34-like [Dendronephthya gigantea]